MKGKNVLLLHLPFWTPMMPPMGISRIKSHLQSYGYSVKTADLNNEAEPRKLYQRYFELLDGNVPNENKGNFYSIGHDVLRNHMMAYIHCKDQGQYQELVRLIVDQTFFVRLGDSVIFKLHEIIEQYFECLKSFTTGFVDEFNPDVLGLSVFRDTLPSAMFVFRFVKNQYPHIKNVMGGSIFSEQLVIGTPDYEFFLAKTQGYIDKILIGQGEVLLHKYLLGELDESQQVCTEQEVQGASLSMPSMNIPDYSDINLNNYLYLGATASTGCLYRCSFCNVIKFFGPFNARDIKQTVDEMEWLYKTHHVPMFYMTDHMINPIVDELSNEISKRNLNINWTAYVRVDKNVCIPQNTIRWRKGGLYCARLGIESGSQHVLDEMGKSITPDQSRRSLDSLANAGIKTTAYFVVGHPGETEDDFQQTLDFLAQCKEVIWEAESDYFHYSYSGQSFSDKWAANRMLVYPEETRDALLIREWSLDCYPSRKEIFRRNSIFSNYCKQLGIPNTYSYFDIHMADERWEKLHSNAVPALLSLRWAP